MAKPKIVICMSSSCFARGNEKTVEACENFLAERRLNEVDVDLGAGLCTGNCAEWPMVFVDGKVYKHVDTLVMRDILEATSKIPGFKLDAKQINGIDRKTCAMVKLYAAGKMPVNFLEVMAFPGGCQNGQCALS